jgi:hypothetical protein
MVLLMFCNIKKLLRLSPLLFLNFLPLSATVYDGPEGTSISAAMTSNDAAIQSETGRSLFEDIIQDPVPNIDWQTIPGTNISFPDIEDLNDYIFVRRAALADCALFFIIAAIRQGDVDALADGCSLIMGPGYGNGQEYYDQGLYLDGLFGLTYAIIFGLKTDNAHMVDLAFGDGYDTFFGEGYPGFSESCTPFLNQGCLRSLPNFLYIAQSIDCPEAKFLANFTCINEDLQPFTPSQAGDIVEVLDFFCANGEMPARYADHQKGLAMNLRDMITEFGDDYKTIAENLFYTGCPTGRDYSFPYDENGVYIPSDYAQHSVVADLPNEEVVQERIRTAGQSPE